MLAGGSLAGGSMVVLMTLLLPCSACAGLSEGLSAELHCGVKLSSARVSKVTWHQADHNVRAAHKTVLRAHSLSSRHSHVKLVEIAQRRCWFLELYRWITLGLLAFQAAV